MAIQVSSDQIPLYDDGVGADGTPIEQLVGGAFGLGLYQKIKNGYTKIAPLYEPGDEIFLFGFSRGAYTARSLAGMIATCGLPAQGFDDSLVDTAFDAYRNKDRRATLLQSLSAFHMDDPHISMVGVWDTVGSLGIPSIIGGVSSDSSTRGYMQMSYMPIMPSRSMNVGPSFHSHCGLHSPHRDR